MGTGDVLVQVSTALMSFLGAIILPLGAALIIGLLVGVLQAATQIQDQTLPQTVKLFVVIGVFAAMMGPMVLPLVRFSSAIFAGFPTMVP